MDAWSSDVGCCMLHTDGYLYSSMQFPNMATLPRSAEPPGLRSLRPREKGLLATPRRRCRRRRHRLVFERT